jgi:hypothetical protein
LEDLQSRAGRCVALASVLCPDQSLIFSFSTHFILASIAYLFTTTYEPSDDMTISALLTYLNAAMPPDKHEDFDTAEVVRAAAALHDRGEISFEGDILHLVH